MEICIVGTGYVGLVTAACFAETGNEVHCVDVNADVIDKLKKGEHIRMYFQCKNSIIILNFRFKIILTFSL